MIFQILFFTSLAVLLLYTTISVIKFGIPKSLSYTHYLWQYEKEKHSWLFTIALIATVFPLLPAFIEYSTESTQFLAFLSAASLGVVGVACCFKECRMTMIVHFVAAVICAICAILWTWINVEFGWLIVAASGLIFGGLGLIQRRAFIFWVEMGAFVLAYIGLYIQMTNSYLTFLSNLLSF